MPRPRLLTSGVVRVALPDRFRVRAVVASITGGKAGGITGGEAGGIAGARAGGIAGATAGGKKVRR